MRMWFNGELVDASNQHVPLLAHTLHYGTGVFEGIRSYEGRTGSVVFRLHDHLQRLLRSAAALGLATNYTADDLAKGVHKVIAANHLHSAYIRPLVFVGQGSMSLDIEGPFGNPVHLLIAAWEWTSYFRSGGAGLSLKLADWKRCFPRPGLNTVKSAGFYVNSYLAHRDAKRSGFDDAIMVDEDGRVAEATAANVFLVAGDILVTPRAASALPGITRDTVMKLARDLGLDTEEREIDPVELQSADEVFLTGTACEVAPVTRINERRLGKGACGEITARIAETYQRVVRNDYAWARNSPPSHWWERLENAGTVMRRANSKKP
jgi:branched-chain amino acid aminotransferase